MENTFNLSEENILKHFGWEVVCESPHEIRHSDGSFASGQATGFVISELRREYIEELYEKFEDEYHKMQAKLTVLKTIKK